MLGWPHAGPTQCRRKRHRHLSHHCAPWPSIQGRVPCADEHCSSMRLQDDPHTRLAPYDYPRRGPGRVLVIDDDDGVRLVMRKQLQHAGFDVVAAASGAEGLAIMRADASIRLVLLDMIMPLMDGWGVR